MWVKKKKKSSKINNETTYELADVEQKKKKRKKKRRIREHSQKTFRRDFSKHVGNFQETLGQSQHYVTRKRNEIERKMKQVLHSIHVQYIYFYRRIRAKIFYDKKLKLTKRKRLFHYVLKQ